MLPEHKLISAAKSGDVSAFEELYRSYNDRIYNFVRGIVASEQDAADVAQDTFVRAWKALPKLRSECAFKGWLYRIALNQAKEALAQRGRRGELGIEGSDEPGFDERQIATTTDGPESATLRNDLASAVGMALSELSPDHRAVVAMHHIEDMDVSEVAKALSVPQGTVLSRLARARAKLKRRLAPYVEAD